MRNEEPYSPAPSLVKVMMGESGGGEGAHIDGLLERRDEGGHSVLDVGRAMDGTRDLVFARALSADERER